MCWITEVFIRGIFMDTTDMGNLVPVLYLSLHKLKLSFCGKYVVLNKHHNQVVGS